MDIAGTPEFGGSEDKSGDLLSFWRGGLLDRAGRALGLVRGNSLDVVRWSLAFIVVAWVPLLLLAVVARLHLGFWSPRLFELTVHVRWWIAVPLLFTAERLLDQRLAQLATYLRESGLVTGSSAQQLVDIERRITSYCNSVLLEAGLLSIAVVMCVGEVGRAFDAAAVYHAAVSLTLFRFLILRWFQRWVFWAVFLVQLSRLKLNLIGVHPDRCGGLGALLLPARALAPVFAALGSVLSADIISRLPPGRSLNGELPTIATFAGLCIVLAVLPLLSFVPLLIRTKRSALLEFGMFGQGYVQAFTNRWLPKFDKSQSPLGSPDIQSLADLGNAQEMIRTMRIMPFARDFIILIVVASLVPLVPAYLRSTDVATLAAQLAKLVL